MSILFLLIFIIWCYQVGYANIELFDGKGFKSSSEYLSWYIPILPLYIVLKKKVNSLDDNQKENNEKS